MEHYVGLDVSLKLTAICIVDQAGKIEREAMVASNPEAIAAFVKSHAPHVAGVRLETGATATWLWTELSRTIANAMMPILRWVTPNQIFAWRIS
jgi:transposase